MEFDSSFRVAMADAEERISRVEEPEAVLADLGKRFQEIYGEPTDPAGGDTPTGNVPA